jgi:hypothetical protein
MSLGIFILPEKKPMGYLSCRRKQPMGHVEYPLGYFFYCRNSPWDMKNIPWDIYLTQEKAHGTCRISHGILILS